MYEHAIPQNIMEYEFKLFAGLTLKQFIYVAVAGGFAFGLFQLNKAGVFPTFFAWLTIPLVLLVGITLGLGSYNRRTMEDWFTSFVRVTRIALRRVWKRDSSTVTYESFFTTKPQAMPTYLAAYFMNQDEFRKLMKMPPVGYSVASNTMQMVQDTPTVAQVVSITPKSAYDYAEPGVNLPAIPNTVAFRLQEDGIAMEGVIAYIKNAQSTVVSALRSNKDGIIYFNQSLADGEYEIDFQSPEAATLPKVKILFQGNTYPLINLTPTA